MTTDQLILNRLIQARINAGLSQSQVARMIGADKATIEAIENGTRPLSAKVFNRLCAIYDISQTWAMTGSNPNFDRQAMLDKARSGGMSFDDANRLADLLETLRQESEVKS